MGEERWACCCGKAGVIEQVDRRRLFSTYIIGVAKLTGRASISHIIKSQVIRLPV